MVLGEMVAIAKKRLGRDDLNRAVITVPAHFNDQQRQATSDGRIAGLEVMRIINEPTAAALAYGLHDLASDENNPQRACSSSTSRGTLDAVRAVHGGRRHVQATGGDTHLGGEDFDAALVEHVVMQYARKRAGTNEALYQLFDEKLELCKSVHPDEAVAVGAAVQGAILRAGMTHGGEDLAPEGCKDLVLLDVTPLSLGIELEGGVMSTLIKRSTPIPCAKTREYTTRRRLPDGHRRRRHEGERPAVSANNKLGEFKIDGIERARRASPRSRAPAPTQIKADRGRLEEEDIQRMIEDAKKYREDAAFATRPGSQRAEEAAAAKAACKDDAKKATLENMLEWLEYDAEDVHGRAQRASRP
ncbi:ATP binding protein [Aureococcus anophagefferens]|nr:ATP binding protein [Aureococcus anophagefferens]